MAQQASGQLLPEKADHRAHVTDVTAASSRRNTQQHDKDIGRQSGTSISALPKKQQASAQNITFGFMDTDDTEQDLEGFVTVTKRHTEYVYVANVKLKSDPDRTIECVKRYVQNQCIEVHKIRILRIGEESISLKLGIPKGSAEILCEDAFWPEGIYCRLWR